MRRQVRRAQVGFGLDDSRAADGAGDVPDHDHAEQ
jgi:hypothetical protein